jgi:hypothetical protein
MSRSRLQTQGDWLDEVNADQEEPRPKPTSVEPAPVDPGQAATETAVNEALQQDGSAGLSKADRQRMEDASIELQKRLRGQYRADMMTRWKAESLRARVMAAFDEHGDMTAEEVTTRFRDVKRQNVIGTVSKLVQDDLLHDTGERRKSGRCATRVYRSNPYPRLPMGHPDTACAAEAEHDQGLDGEEPWIAINYAARLAGE